MSDRKSAPKQRSVFQRFWLDVILGSAFIFALIGLFASMTAFKIFDIFDPIGDAFADMEMTDIVFSQLRDEPVVDERVVLVNIGNRSRFEIAMMIDSISQFDPAVIGMDTFFYIPKEDDPIGDSLLAANLGKVENLVMPIKALYDDSLDIFDMETSWPTFNMNAEMAHVNLITDAEVQEDLKMCREFFPAVPIGPKGEEENVPAFAVKLASYLDKEKAESFLENSNEVEVINYRGNIIDYGATKFGSMFFAIDHYEILEPYFNEETMNYERRYIPEILTNKIIILCFMGEVLGDREALEDKYFTPLNETYVGRAFPDMYGGVIHANIITMILNEDYIAQLEFWQSILLAIIICFLNVTAFTWIYKKIPRWYDGITKLIQAVEFLAILFIMIYVMDFFSLKLDLTLALVVVALAGDSLEVYFGVVKNSLTREGRKELFRVSKF